MWFVIYVKPGAEEQAVGLLKSTNKGDGLEEVFCPMAECVYCENGEEMRSLIPMFDGCVFAIASNKGELRDCMRRAEGIDELCNCENHFVAMNDGEGDFIDSLASPGKRVVVMSEAVVDDNGSIQIERGPLLGREREIRKRKGMRRWVYLDTSIAGRPASAHIGLRVTRNAKVHPWER